MKGYDPGKTRIDGKIDNLIKFNVQFEFDTQSSTFKCGSRHYFAESSNISAKAAVLADELFFTPNKKAATKCGGPYNMH